MRPGCVVPEGGNEEERGQELQRFWETVVMNLLRMLLHYVTKIRLSKIEAQTGFVKPLCTERHPIQQ